MALTGHRQQAEDLLQTVLAQVTGSVPERATADVTAGVDLSLALREALYRLAPRYRAVLVLRYLEDLPDDEIAKVLGCKPTTVRSQVARALARLRVLCADLDIGSEPSLRPDEPERVEIHR
jgi:DNA-directed RNA polymerase specialized sigma subunit